MGDSLSHLDDILSMVNLLSFFLPRREGASLLFSPIRPRPTHHVCDVT